MEEADSCFRSPAGGEEELSTESPGGGGEESFPSPLTDSWPSHRSGGSDGSPGLQGVEGGLDEEEQMNAALATEIRRVARACPPHVGLMAYKIAPEPPVSTRLDRVVQSDHLHFLRKDFC